jgi:signal peptidase II
LDRLIVLLSVAGVVLITDQGSKLGATLYAAGRHVAIGPLVAIRPIRTVRPGFSRRTSRIGLVLTWCAACGSMLAIDQLGVGPQSDAAHIGMWAALGGAAGNLLDILRRRAVTDFIDVGWWPVFNLADVAIVAGLIAAFVPTA